MTKFQSISSLRPWLAALLIGGLLAACGGGGRDPILGSGGIVPLPTVTGVTPTNGATGVAVNNPNITAAFSEPMAPLTGAASFTVTCAAPCVSPQNSVVSLDGTGKTATYALAGGTSLAPLTLYTATIAGATSAGTGLPISGPYTWQFTTGAALALTRPTVTAVAPANNATGVATNNTAITVAFSEAVAAINGTASFTVTCAAPCTSPTGTVTLDGTNRIATFTSAASLATLTTYTATVTGVRSLATGLAMASSYVWRFSTGLVADTTRPRVASTFPVTSTPGPTAGVPANTAINATFTEDMAPATLNTASFTVTCAAPCVSPAGSVSYVAGNRTAIFAPAASLAAGVTYTATITTAATDLAGNSLGGNLAALPAASNYVWTFSTVAAVPAANVTVQSTNPANSAGAVCTDATINATFNVPSGLRMNPASITSAVFTVTGPGPAVVTPSSVVLDAATGRVATFTPFVPLEAGVTYRASIRGGATGAVDMAIPANAMATDYAWTFTAAACAVAMVPSTFPLGSASSFGTFGGNAGMTNQGINTVVNGDIGTTAVSTAVTGFHDAGPGCTYTETGSNIGTVNGLIYTAAPPPTVACPSEGTATTFAIALQARADALITYNALVARPGGPDPGAGNLSGKVLAPGVYTAAAGSFMIQGSDLTLDAQGNANAVWVFQMASTLTVGGPGAAAPRSVILVNGAQAKNVFWQVGSAATINAGGGGTFAGTVISQAGTAVSTAGNAAVVTINGRLLSLGASVTLVNTVINVPAP